MQCGVFGKYPAKRDFVAHNLPRQFLSIWEDWLQSSVAASRSQLGAAWQDAFLTAPLWRFWIGKAVGTMTAAGVMMPSVDGIGRYFPLTVCACAPEGQAIAPPMIDPMEQWYAAAETALLQALDEGFAGEAAAIADSVPFPETIDTPQDREPKGSYVLRKQVQASELGAAFIQAEIAGLMGLYDMRSVWWTLGGATRPAELVICQQMPDPYAFAGFLTGTPNNGDRP